VRRDRHITCRRCHSKMSSGRRFCDTCGASIPLNARQPIPTHGAPWTLIAVTTLPLLVIFALLLGGQLYGIIGAFIALPIAAMVRSTAVYLRRHVRLEPWDLPAAPKPFGPEPPAADPRIEEPEGARCPECGAARQPEAAACPQCGTELGDADEEASAAASAPQ